MADAVQRHLRRAVAREVGGIVRERLVEEQRLRAKEHLADVLIEGEGRVELPEVEGEPPAIA